MHILQVRKERVRLVANTLFLSVNQSLGTSNHNFICLNCIVLLLPGKNKISKSKETAEWNCSVCKIDVHLFASIVCDGIVNQYIKKI
jgi:RNase P subunit RPR2